MNNNLFLLKKLKKAKLKARVLFKEQNPTKPEKRLCEVCLNVWRQFWGKQLNLVEWFKSYISLHDTSPNLSGKQPKLQGQIVSLSYLS